MMLTYNEFKELVKRELKKLLGDEYKVLEDKIVKNNDIVLDTLFVAKKDRNVTPMIYIQEWYEKYQAGDCLADMIEEMKELLKGICPIDTTIFEKDFTHLSKRITMALVNKEWNQMKLKEHVKRDFLDLTIIFRIRLQSKTHMSCTCDITKEC